jgi:hypothetical protein
MTILANGAGRAPEELLAKIATVNDVGTEPLRLVTPLMSGDARDLQESIGAQKRFRGREGMVHAMVTQVLLGWCATATGQTRRGHPALSR